MEPDRIEGSETDAPLYEGMIDNEEGNIASEMVSVRTAVRLGWSAREAVQALASDKAKERLRAEGFMW